MTDITTATGRPAGRPAGRKPVLNLRVAPPLLLQLKLAAVTHGLSISEEATKRLNRSFERDELRRLIRDELALAAVLEERDEQALATASQDASRVDGQVAATESRTKPRTA